jgi:hypothetical protein
MIFKTIRHKEHKDLFGTVISEPDFQAFMGQCSTPDLLPETSNFDDYCKYWFNQGEFQLVEDLNKNYEMVSVKLEVL